MEKRTKKIAITGGKGGTGKSTVACLMADELLKQGKKVILCDCDVECPNDYLLIGKILKKPETKVYAEFPKLIKEKCTKCGLCAKTCRSNAIFQAPGEYPIFIKDLCSGCGACWTVCPFGAIKPQKEEIGKIYLSKIQDSTPHQKLRFGTGQGFKIQDFHLVTGIAKSGLEETGPVVAETKKFALNLAEKIKADVVLFDTAAGTHCPVINALLGVDFAFAVTEPTPMGAYDLNLILDLCKKLKIPAKIILNQADLGNKNGVEKIAKKYKIKIEKEIPYSKELVKNYSKGQLLKLSNIEKEKTYGININ